MSSTTPGDLVIAALVCAGIGSVCLLGAGITALSAAIRYARHTPEQPS
jgi:hypothetical protein